MRFTAKGHKNISCTHRNTLEFTKDKDVSEQGDCIVACSADFKISRIKKLLQYSQLRITIQAGGASDQVLCRTNKSFNSDHEIVLRITDFLSDRTLGFRADKAAKHLDQGLRKELKKGKRADVLIEPRIKLLIFDFDDTLEDWKSVLEFTHTNLAKDIGDKFSLDQEELRKILDEADQYYSHKGAGNSPRYFDRHLWFSELFESLHLDHTRKDVEFFVRRYWKYANNHARLMPGMFSFLKLAKARFRIAVMSDSDGSKAIKKERLEKTGMMRYLDFWMTSDDTGQNKPSMEFYRKILKRFKVKPEECIMFGDKPEVDLKLAKELGMLTVWVKHGMWAEHEKKSKFSYVDYYATGAEDIKQIVEKF